MSDTEALRRVGQVLRLRPEHRERYIRYHTEVWPEVLENIRRCNIRNYSIFLKGDLLFAYFEYIGDDFERDMEALGTDPKTQEWWSIMEPMQMPVADAQEGEWWAQMDEVFHVD